MIHVCLYLSKMIDILQNFDVYLGSVAGSIIQFNIGKNNKKTYHLRNDDKCEITSLSWGRTNYEVLIGYKKGNAKIYNLTSEESINIPTVEKNPVVGIIPFNNDIILATNNGNLYQWSNGKIHSYLTNEDDKKTIEKIVVNPYDQNILGLGGVNYDIKLYDMTTKKIVFQGKADRHDELELSQPISINSIVYFDKKSGLDIGTVTKQGQIRIYDMRSQRRPVKIFKNTESVYTTISTTNIDKEICVGSTKGYLQIMDLRNDIKPLKTFKGFMGGITDIYCDSEYPIVASCCLDRHFRIHDLNERKLIYEDYVKIQIPAVLMRSKNFVTSIIEETDEQYDSDGDKKRQRSQEKKKSKKIKTI